MTDRLLDAQVELLARLHLAGFMWGDCSLSNTLFRLDAGALAAYLVDAETAEIHAAALRRPARATTLDLAYERVGRRADGPAGRRAAGRRTSTRSRSPTSSCAATTRCGHELTDEQVHPRHEQRYRIAERIRRLNELGFDVDEVELIDDAGGGSRLRLTTRVAEPGHHRRVLFARTGLDVQENQARRLLADIASFRGWLEQVEQRRVPEAVAASRWLAEVYEPVVAAIPRAPAHPAGRGGDLPRDPRAPLVPVRGGRRRRRHHGRGRRTTSPGCCPTVPEDLVTPVSAMTERGGVDDPEATAPTSTLDRRRSRARRGYRRASAAVVERPPPSRGARPVRAPSRSDPRRRRRAAGRAPGCCSAWPPVCFALDLVSKLRRRRHDRARRGHPACSAGWST